MVVFIGVIVLISIWVVGNVEYGISCFVENFECDFRCLGWYIVVVIVFKGSIGSFVSVSCLIFLWCEWLEEVDV